VILVVGGAYLGWVWLPLYFDHYTVKQVVSDYMNQAVKNHDDAQLLRDMVAKIHALGQVDAVDLSGRPVRVPAVPLEEGAVTWERDKSAKTLRVAFEYERRVVYPFIDRTDVHVFTLDRTGDITIPDWGPAR
jgi:hypothetical protein